MSQIGGVCNAKDRSFCQTLESFSTEEIRLIEIYVNTPHGIHTEKIALEEWSQFVDIARGVSNTSILAKAYLGTTAKKAFQRQINEIAHLIKTFDARYRMLDYTPYASFFLWRDRHIVGLHVRVGKESHYFTFQGPCQRLVSDLLYPKTIASVRAEEEVPVLIEDILEVLVHLQKNGWTYSPIQPASICVKDVPMAGRAKYIFYDWSQLYPITWGVNKKAHPLTNFLSARGKEPFDMNAARAIMATDQHPLVEAELLTFVEDQIKQWRAAMGNVHRRTFFEYWKFATDLFSLGLMIYAMAVYFQLPEAYKEFARDLCTPFRAPREMKNASVALQEWKKRFGEK